MPEMVGKQGQRTPTQRGFPPKEREMEINTDKYPRPNASMATDKDYRQEGVQTIPTNEKSTVYTQMARP